MLNMHICTVQCANISLTDSNTQLKVEFTTSDSCKTGHILYNILEAESEQQIFYQPCLYLSGYVRS